jgi:hypothetical protein
MRFSLLSLALFLAFACSRPSSEEYFVLKQDAPDGVYSFRLDLSDTTVLYDLSLYIRQDRRDTSGFPLTALWYKGDSLRFSEELFFPAGRETAPYRSGVAMAEPGEWTLSLRPCCPPAGFSGMGLICKRNGTR